MALSSIPSGNEPEKSAKMAANTRGLIRVHAGADVLGRAAAGIFTQVARKSLKSAGRFAVALSGGETPVRAYQLLSQPPYRDLVSWNKTHIFWSDERCVPTDNPRNNARMAMEALLYHVPIPKGQIHPIPTDQPPEKAAEAYETLLREFFHDGPPRFDLVLLGLGVDGHTASLFPKSSILDEEEHWVKEIFFEEKKRVPYISHRSRTR